MNRKDFEQLLEGKFTIQEIQMIMMAYRFSKYGHKNQLRKNGDRYFNHPREVAAIAMTEFNIFDYELIIAALLHDIPEDSHIFKNNDIELIFGTNVYLLVSGMTKDPGEDKEEYLKKIFSGKIPNINMLLLVKLKTLKILDRIHNLRDAIKTNVWSIEKLEKYKEHARKFMLVEAKKINTHLAQKLEELF
ncbi:hypothetical protein A2331_05655 [Candidatus Falkowbacteria bacterium RIFOXYB2_FULL_34_18]|uniref:HD/PDEase domain-containing protein n=1 Tax=Candidatus Falkowbacteria bacterium RIFOXYD2_FULL_34_120 TaxID=1798007 RepID=A0A1F5TR22_9BACT|nr:MAG: hypothetical protein A2331_05655 [Candidatus Falkowbacteria bacterium RIFOXYB2_FULL_34_18]OGF29806.1 MAG: hypothetical protein A2500_01375 [Candidatus Falkowbacteria bacterium RIFOXYC12_FULL_34_55]OGF37079.1 MAG: hypothetical protein A2466_05830 [Candidatus Falkowbacteria bacterium RIFOXYC2_FULL_34_220]OGF39271.1 MAG: hypothetical protein A2515_01040 [Candidatus Falkowbacteria bacterium RIFOXYD12_FULL_34_57]OGF41375.1 MAG: hypothetical protein A2531_07245 [Candidatus Falkowbacteria bact